MNRESVLVEVAKLTAMHREIGEWLQLYESLLARGMSPERAYDIVLATASEEQGERQQADQERFGGRDVTDHVEDDVQQQDQQGQKPADPNGRPGTVHAIPPSPGAESSQVGLPTVGLSCRECDASPLLATYESETDSWVLRCSVCGWLNRIGPVFDGASQSPIPSAAAGETPPAPSAEPSGPAAPSPARSSGTPASAGPGLQAEQPAGPRAGRSRPRRPDASTRPAPVEADVQSVSSISDTSTITSTTEDRLLSACPHCGRPVWKLDHWMTHSTDLFDIQPAADGECMLNFETGFYQIMQPVVSKKRSSGRKRERKPTDPKFFLGEGPYRYHTTRCAAAAKAFGWRTPA